MKLTQNSQSGISIVEIIIAVALLLVIALLYQGTANNLTLTRESDNEELALRIAQNEIDSLRQGGYASLPSTGSFSSTELNQLPSGSGSLTVTDFSATVKQVVVTVQWNSPRSGNQTVTLTTAIANNGGL